MKWLIVVIGIIAALIIGLYFIGKSMPREHSATGERTYDVPVTKLWAVVTNVELYPHWRSDVRKVRSRSMEGNVLSWKEIYDGEDVLPFVVAEVDSMKKWVVKIDDSELPFGGTWTYTFEPVDGETKLTISEEGYVDNAFIRLLAGVFLNPNATIQRFLIDLEQPVEALNEPINLVAWLAGGWSTDKGDYELWKRASDTSYSGIGFGISNAGDTVVRESLMIWTKDDSLVYEANVPQNPSAVEFRMTSINDTMVSFANPEHDFPQKITYYLTSDSTVQAEVIGERKGQRSGFTLKFKRQ